MRKIIAYEASDGSVHKTLEAANRIDNALLIAPLQEKLEKLQRRAKEAGLGNEYALLQFIHDNWEAIQVFFPATVHQNKGTEL